MRFGSYRVWLVRALLWSACLSSPSVVAQSCGELWLDSSVAFWRELEAKYQNIRQKTDVVRVGSPENKAINALLDAGLSNVLANVHRHFDSISDLELIDVLHEVEATSSQSGPISYLDDEIVPAADEFYRILGIFNASVDRASGPVLECLRGGTTVDAFDHIDDYRVFRTGRGPDPFAVPDDSWCRLLGEDRARFRTAYDAIREFKSSARLWARLNAAVDGLEAQAPDVRRTLEFLQKTWRLNGQDYSSYRGWIKRDTFDMSSVPAERGPQNGTFFATPLPIVDYGLEFNRTLRRTVQVTTLLLERRMAKDLRRVQEAAPLLLGRETARGRHHRRTWYEPVSQREDEPLLRIVSEGMYSLAQALNFLMNDRVSGSADPVDVVDRLTVSDSKSHLSPVVEFTSMLRMATLGRSSLVGLRYPRPLQRSASGQLGLHDALRTELGERAARDKADCEEWTVHRNHRRAIRCPVARRAPGGLQDAVDVFRRVYHVVERAWQSGRSHPARSALTD